MGSRFKEETPFALYDPERDWDGQKHNPSRARPIPVSRAMLSPRAQRSGLAYYDPEQDHELYMNKGTMYSRSEPPPTSPRAQPFGYYDPELDGVRDRERARQGHPIRHVDPESLHKSPHNTSYGGTGSPPRAFSPLPDEEFAAASGRGRGSGYGHGPHPTDDTNGRIPSLVDREPGYQRPVRPDRMDEDDLPRRGASFGRGKDSPVPPLGAGRYVYDGLQQPYAPAFEEDLDVPPAPISSNHAHQVYATVFTDPVYNRAVQSNAHAGYSEEPEKQRVQHRKEDVLRHPDQF